MIAIHFEKVSKSFKSGFKFKKIRALHDIDFEVQAEEIFGFLGPNGAGKSTSIKLLMNFIRPDSGRIQVNGLLTSKDPFQQHVGYLPETPCFYENLTGAETLWFTGKASGLNGRTVKKRSRAVLGRLQLEQAGHNPIRTYSKGMKQRLGLAVALIHDPQIYILDEPMSGLDPIGRRLIADVILELRAAGKTVFFSSHILSDIERLCDRIGILNKGELLYCGPVVDIVKGGASLEAAFIRFIEEDERTSHG